MPPGWEHDVEDECGLSEQIDPGHVPALSLTRLIYLGKLLKFSKRRFLIL